jgi:hypothetical protein
LRVFRVFRRFWSGFAVDLSKPFGWRLGGFTGAFVPQLLLAQLASAHCLVIAPLLFVRRRL